MMMMGLGMGGWWLLIVLGVVVFVIILVRLLSVRGPGNRGEGRPFLSSARLLLDERYARGELTSEEYQERVRTLRGPDQ